MITLPKVNFEEEQSNFIESQKKFKTEENEFKNSNKEKKEKDIMSNIYSNTEIKVNDNNYNTIVNIDNDNYNINRNNLYSKRIKSVDNFKRLKKSYLERGEEEINKLAKYSKMRNSNNVNFNFKVNKTLDTVHHFKFEIRRLNKWDFNNISKEKKYETERINSSQKIKNIISEIKQSQRMNWLMEVKNNKEQFKIICRNKHLKDFVNKAVEDQNAIYMKNIKVFKKGFNFNIFDKDGHNKEIVNKGNKNQNELKTDTYNDIMKEKLLLEENLSHELKICAEEVYKYKTKIENQINKKYNLNNKLLKLKKKEDNINEEFHENIKILDLQLLHLENTINLKINENKNGNEIKINKLKSKEILNRLDKFIKSPKNNSKNANLNMGNVKGTRRISIINFEELNKVRTYSNNNNNKINDKNNSNNLNQSNNLKESINLIKNNELIESKDEELLIKKNLLAQKTILDKDHDKEISKIKDAKNEIKNEINKINEEIKRLSKDLSFAKNFLNDHIQSLSDYYYQILKKGIDVRRNGLSWVVIKLMELNAFIDYNHFPNFLDIHQIDYLMRIGAKIYEVKELIKLFQLLKQREKKIKETHYNEDRKKEKEEKKEKLNEIKKLNKNKIGNNYAEFLDEIQEKYDNAVNFNIDEEIEDKQIDKTSKYLRDVILHNYEKKIDLYYIPGSLAEYFSKDKKFRQYFDDVYYLNEEINKRQKDIKVDKENELKYYRNKYKINYFEEQKENKNTNNFIRMDKKANMNNFLFEENTEDNASLNIRKLVFAALFGNGTAF